ncbi:DNA repair protein [Mycoplasmatota bacterium]|nr:DNA repair protein [Mycoplasmatota bacterium]
MTSVQSREVYKEVLKKGCVSIIVSHNHISSPFDVSILKRFIEVEVLMEIGLLDHFKIGFDG